MLTLLLDIWKRIRRFTNRFDRLETLMRQILDLLTGEIPDVEPEASARLIAIADRVERIATDSKTLAERLKAQAKEI